jgi:hypothetical protein
MLIHDVPKRKFLPIFERSEPIIKDHTAVKQFKECPRKYFYRMVIGKSAKKQSLESIFAWGTAVHKFAELYSISYDMVAALTAADKLYKKPVPDKPAWMHLDMATFLRTLAKVQAFFDEEKRGGFIKTTAVEAPFNIELPNGNQIGGRMDAIIKFGGQTWVRDYKTTTKRLDYFRSGLDPNDQATRYVYALSRLQGWNSTTQVSSAKANGVEFVLIGNEAPTKSSPKTTKIEKVSISRSNDQLVSFEQQEIHWQAMIDICREADEWPMAETSQCTWCDYRPVCTAPTEGSMKSKLQTDYVHSPWDHQKVEQEAGI